MQLNKESKTKTLRKSKYVPKLTEGVPCNQEYPLYAQFNRILVLAESQKMRLFFKAWFCGVFPGVCDIGFKEALG